MTTKKHAGAGIALTMLQQLHHERPEQDLDHVLEEALAAGLASAHRAEFISSLRRWMTATLDGCHIDIDKVSVHRFAA